MRVARFGQQSVAPPAPRSRIPPLVIACKAKGRSYSAISLRRVALLTRYEMLHVQWLQNAEALPNGSKMAGARYPTGFNPTIGRERSAPLDCNAYHETNSLFQWLLAGPFLCQSPASRKHDQRGTPIHPLNGAKTSTRITPNAFNA